MPMLAVTVPSGPARSKGSGDPQRESLFRNDREFRWFGDGRRLNTTKFVAARRAGGPRSGSFSRDPWSEASPALPEALREK
jgi:hypothetical protein